MGRLVSILLFLNVAKAETIKANDLVQFLDGKWDNVSFEIADNMGGL